MSQVQFRSRMQLLLSIVFVISIMLGFLSIARADTSVALWQGDKKGAVSMTFDDGSTDQFDLAFPLLRDRDLKATFFIIAEKLELEWYPDRIAPLVLDDQEIGSHGYRHDSLTTMSESELDAELYDSQAVLQELTGQDVATIAYPYGDYNSYLIECYFPKEQSQIQAAFTCEQSHVSKDTNKWKIPRYGCRLN